MPCAPTHGLAGRFVARVVVPLPLYRKFDYAVPAQWPHPPTRGCRVRVRFGARTLVGFVLSTRGETEPDAGLRELEACLDDPPLLPAELLALCEWAADYYQHPLGEVLAAAWPGPLDRPLGPSLASLHGTDAERAYALSDAGRSALTDGQVRGARQRAWLEACMQPQTRRALGASPAQLGGLLERGWLVPQAVACPALQAPPPLTAEQAHAWQALLGMPAGFSVHVLEGVTGSGKTELYLRRIQTALEQGLQALVLTPEIGLVTPLCERLRERFGHGVLEYHSDLAAGARTRCWQASAHGEARIVVGTRSAVWLPFARLGIVVVDEEHDGAYKQQDGFRYSARDVAILRASRLGIPVLLGSATPALETQQRIAEGRYRHLQLTRRVHDAPPPPPRILDVRRLPLENGLSSPLLDRAGEHLDHGGQVLFFLNRRGYAPLLLCHACGWNAPCPQCDAHLTLHRSRGLLICHHCGHRQTLPRQCPDCGHARLMPVGEGTERVEQALLQRFPGRRVVRLDADRAADAKQRATLLDDIHKGRAQILVGTQMLAKGHDFPGVSFVGIVSADQALYGTDFRAIERMGQLVTQVAGRAGRSARTDGRLPAEVWLQTHAPEHPLLQTLASGGYRALCAELLRERRMAGLPPFAHLCLIRADSREAAAPLAFLDHGRSLFEHTPGVTAMDPIPSGMERRAGYTRAQLLLSAPSRSALHRALSTAVPQFDTLPGARRVRWSVDVDPHDLM